MALLYLIRHGRAAAAWDQDPDPGLAPEGRQQAQAAVEAMRPHGPLPLVVSPMARTRETAQPFAAAWQVEPRIDTRIREIPSPAGLELGQRGAWLRQVAAMEWQIGRASCREAVAGGGGGGSGSGSARGGQTK